MGQFAGPGLQAVGSVIGAFGAYSSGQAEAGAAHYNANIQRQNAAVSRMNAQIAEQSGEAQVGISGQKTKAVIADTTAHQAASGVDTQGGSYTDVRSSEREIGALDAMALRSNAARTAYGYKAQAQSEEDQATLSDTQGKNAAVAGELNAASTFLGGASQASTSFQKYQLAGGFSG
jgi:hypothetical protein